MPVGHIPKIAGVLTVRNRMRDEHAIATNSLRMQTTPYPSRHASVKTYAAFIRPRNRRRIFPVPEFFVLCPIFDNA